MLEVLGPDIPLLQRSQVMPDRAENSRYRADRRCKGNAVVWVQAWGHARHRGGKVPGTPCCFLGYPNCPH